MTRTYPQKIEAQFVKHVEIWGYGLTDANGTHAIDRVEYELTDNDARVFVGTIAVHHIAMEPDGGVSIALNCPIETVKIEENAAGLWLSPKSWDEIADALEAAKKLAVFETGSCCKRPGGAHEYHCETGGVP